MKNGLLTLLFLVTALFLAQSYAGGDNCSTCCCTPCCCPNQSCEPESSPTHESNDCPTFYEPYCQPQPCASTAYPPAYYNLDCAYGVYIGVDFLYWYGKETGLIYAISNDTVTTTQGDLSLLTIVPNKVHRIEESWDPGVRVALGYTDCCDGWDTKATWTYFHTSDRESTSVESIAFDTTSIPITVSLISPWNTPSDLGLASSDTSAGLSYWERVKASWRMNLNTVDFEFGKRYWIGQCVTIRPFVGIRGGWVRTRFRVNMSTNLPTPQTQFIISEKTQFKKRFWGWGMFGGFQPNLHLGCGFSLFGFVDAALLWGRFKIDRDASGVRQDITTTTATGNFEFGTARDRFTAMQPILDLGAGVSWDTTFCRDRYRFGIDAGWEHHIWFDHNHLLQLRGEFQFNDISNSNTCIISYRELDETYGNLTLAGFTLRARFEF